MTMGCEIKLEKVGCGKLNKSKRKKKFLCVFVFHYLLVTDNFESRSLMQEAEESLNLKDIEFRCLKLIVLIGRHLYERNYF